MTKIANRSVLITGGAAGIGKLTAERCLKQRAYKVILWDINEAKLLETKEDFAKNFNDYPFGEEDLVHQWPSEKEVVNKEFDSQKSDKVELDMSNWAQGKYKLTLQTKDKFGNEIERVYVLSGTETKITAELLSPKILEASETNKVQGARLQCRLKDAIQELEREMIREGLKRTGWNKSRLAKELGISRAGLINKVEKYNLDKRKIAAAALASSGRKSDVG